MPRLTLPRLVTALTFIAIFGMAARVSLDTDTWWHLRTGQWIVENRAIPQVDVFSHTRAGEAWRIPGWLVQVPLYWLFENFGYAGLNLFTALVVALAFALVYPLCSGHPLLRAFVLVLAATVSSVYWSARPQIISFLLAAAFAFVLYRWRTNRPQFSNSPITDSHNHYLLWLIPLMAVWANSHGGFAIGFILIALTLAGEGLKVFANELAKTAPFEVRAVFHASRFTLHSLLPLILTAFLCALAVMLNPAGPEMLLYPFKTVGIGVLREFIQEWQAPNFHNLYMQPFLWLLFATFITVAFSRRAPDVTDLVLVCGAAYLGFLAARNMPLLALVAPPLLTRHAVYVWENARPSEAASVARPPFLGNPLINWILLITLTLVAALKVITVLPASLNEKELKQTVPLDAAAYILRERPPGPMFNSYNYGAYLMWALYPAYPVYTDGRTDLYDDAFLREYLRVSFGRPGWEEVLDARGIQLVLIETDSLLGDRLRESAAWREVYGDEVAVVFTRSGR